MPRKRKVIYLSRFFEENVELVANMCVKCYQQEEVKVTAINRKFSNAIKSRRLESLQKKPKLVETNSEEISSDLITQTLDENFDGNASVSTDSEEPSLDLHDTSSSELGEDSSSNLTSASNVSLNEIRSNLEENIDSQSIVENNNSCNFLDNDDTFDQATDCENTFKKFEHISNDTDATFKNICNNVLKNEDNDENIIPNAISSSFVENNSETISNNILNRIKCRSQYEEDTSSDSSEESFNFFQERQPKPENISADKISVASQSIFKTLNSKNSRLYDDFSTNVNSGKNYKHKTISSVKYSVNRVQLNGCTATFSNEDLTSVNNDKQSVSSSQCHEEIVETTNDDSIIELINRIHSPVEFLTDNNKIDAAKEKINALTEKVLEETQDYKIIEAKENLKEINTVEESTKESCFSQYFSQKSSNGPEKHSQIVSECFPSITNKAEATKRKINFSKLRKKI